jgi:hypothetical protein
MGWYIVLYCVHWIGLAQDRDQWKILVKTVMILQVQ